MKTIESFRVLLPADWPQVAEIYKRGIKTGNATFEQTVPTWEEWNDSHFNTCRIVKELQGQVIGWAALSYVSRREVYKGVAEVSVYVHSNFYGQRIGSLLLAQLIQQSEKNGFWTLQSSIFLENEASIHMHKKLGFTEVGVREKIGKMHGQWRNTIILERRSKITGV